MPWSSRTTPPSRPARDLHLAVGLRERPPHRHHRGHEPRDQDQDEHRGDVRRPAGGARPGAEGRRVAGAAGLAVSAGVSARRPVPHRGTSRAPGSLETPRVAIIGSRTLGVPGSEHHTEHPEDERADLPVRLHRLRPRFRAGPELQRGLADHVPAVRGPAPQDLQRRRRRFKGSGFYRTDNRADSKSSATTSSSSDSPAKSDAGKASDSPSSSTSAKSEAGAA